MANFCFHAHNRFGRENAVRLFLSILSNPKQVKNKNKKNEKITERMAKTGTNQSRLTVLLLAYTYTHVTVAGKQLLI